VGLEVIKYCMGGVVEVSFPTLAGPVGLLNKQLICLFIFMLFQKFHWRKLEKRNLIHQKLAERFIFTYIVKYQRF
jgi:hypothetical protein